MRFRFKNKNFSLVRLVAVRRLVVSVYINKCEKTQFRKQLKNLMREDSYLYYAIYVRRDEKNVITYSRLWQ